MYQSNTCLVFRRNKAPKISKNKFSVGCFILLIFFIAASENNKFSSRIFIIDLYFIKPQITRFQPFRKIKNTFRDFKDIYPWQATSLVPAPLDPLSVSVPRIYAVSRSVFCEHHHRTSWIHQHPLIFYHQPCLLLKHSGSPFGVSFSSLEIYPAFVAMTSATPEGGPTGRCFPPDRHRNPDQGLCQHYLIYLL